MKVDLQYVQVYRNRHGKVYYYFRRHGQSKISLPGPVGSAAFLSAYNLALKGIKKKDQSVSSPPGSISAAIALYYTDNSFLSFAAGTRKMRRAILERFRAQEGAKPLALIETKHIAQRLGKLKPFASRNWLKTLRGFMRFAVATGLRKDDPTATFELVEARAGTIHTWTEDEIAIFERHHAVGTRARLAMALLLYTAARRGDAVRLGPQNVRAGRLRYRQQKTGRALEIPLHPELAAIIEASSPNLGPHAVALSFLSTMHGKPFSAAGFGNWFKEMCREAGLPHCSAHGLRKAQARRLAEAGCTVHEIAAITGHKTLKEVQRYTDAADQARLADAAIARTATVRRRDDGRA